MSISEKGKTIIKQDFRSFYRKHPYLPLQELVERFAVFGGIEDNLDIELFEPTQKVLSELLKHRFEYLRSFIAPSYLLEPPYRSFLVSVARGDGKTLSVFHKAKLSEKTGYEIAKSLADIGVLRVEVSREAPLRSSRKQKLKKELRRYKIQDKLRFVKPFYRFWFGFIVPFETEIQKGDLEGVLGYFSNHSERLVSLVYEQLCNALLRLHHPDIVTGGSFWDKHGEYDIVAVTEEKKVIVGECKYKSRKMCRNELNKLRQKVNVSGFRVDRYALFSKSGFSNELLDLDDTNLSLFDLNALEQLIK